ncbi:hypothetical protein [Poseidonocella sp. HB161398]|uniref:hypothetical protein n=1 Tax=Poseidonocella sp. HB161398 TaxID=2320855 RepID=UPI0011089880|nr:hypothetical protein [Poseidonocella sp. HB161398]
MTDSHDEGARPVLPSRQKSIAEFLDGEDSRGEDPWDHATIKEGPDGSIILSVREPEGSVKAWREYNVSFLAGQGLRPILETGLLHAVRKGAAGSHGQLARRLRRGWAEFAGTTQRPGGAHRRDIGIRDLAAADLEAFAIFLRALSVGNDERRNRAGTLRSVLEAAALSGKLDPDDALALDEIRNLPIYRDLPKRSQQPSDSAKSDAEEAEKFLSHARLEAIHEAAERDVAEITEQWDADQRRISAARACLDRAPHVTELMADRWRALAWIGGRCPGPLPTSRQAQAHDPMLYHVLFDTRRGGLGLGNVVQCFQGRSYELVPFLILLLIRLRWNVSTLTGLEWSDIREDGDIITLVPAKRRSFGAQKRQEPAGDPADPLSLCSILRVLREMTARARTVAPSIWKDRVFLAIALRNSNGSRIIDPDALLESKPSRGDDALSCFIENAGLDRFQPKALRPTVIDAVIRWSEKLPVGQLEARHRQQSTTIKHYVSVETAERRRLILAEMPGQMQRWAMTDGRIDPRFLPAGSDIRSATPGFGCLDPYDSPLPGQEQGRLCRAEWHCPSCPLVILRADDARQVAYALAYAEAAARATELDPGTSARLLAAYDAMLRQVPDATLRQAASLPKPSVQIPG